MVRAGPPAPSERPADLARRADVFRIALSTMLEKFVMLDTHNRSPQLRRPFAYQHKPAIIVIGCRLIVANQLLTQGTFCRKSRYPQLMIPFR